MLPLLLVVPGIIALFEKVAGPVLAASHAPIISALGSLFASSTGFTSSGIIGIFEQYMGQLTSEQRQQFQLELDSLLGQIQIETVNAQSPSLWGKARGFLTWGLSINVVINATVFEAANILRMCGKDISELQSMDPVTLGFLSSLLGLLVWSKTKERINDVADDHRE